MSLSSFPCSSSSFSGSLYFVFVLVYYLFCFLFLVFSFFSRVFVAFLSLIFLIVLCAPPSFHRLPPFCVFEGLISFQGASQEILTN
jgi:hypothetical protein